MLNASSERCEVRTVAEMGWRGAKNGELLRRTREAGFGAIVPADRHIEHQQNIARPGIGLVVMHPRRVRMRELAPLVDAVLAALDHIGPGQIVQVQPTPA